MRYKKKLKREKCPQRIVRVFCKTLKLIECCLFVYNILIRFPRGIEIVPKVQLWLISTSKNTIIHTHHSLVII